MPDKENIYGIKYEVDIESLKQSTSEAQKQIKLANSEFNRSASELDDWATSVEGVSAKIKQMNTILQAQKTKLAQSQQEYNDNIDSLEKYADQIDEAKRKKQELITQYGEESQQVKEATNNIDRLEREQTALIKATDNLKVSINNQQATVNKTEKSLKYYEEQLEEVKEAQDRAEKSGRSLEEELEDIRKKSDEAEDSVGGLSDGFTVMKGVLANLIATGISSFISYVGSAIEETREFRTELGKLEATAETVGASFDKAKANLREVNSITNDTGAGVEGLNNLMSAGFDGEALDQITDELLGASIKWKDTLKFEGLSDGLQETLATGSAIGPFAEMIERAGGSLDVFDKGLQQAIKDGTEQNYVLTYLSQYGLTSVKQAYEENNKTLIDSANATYDYQAKLSELAEKVEPIMISIKQGFTDLLTSILAYTNGVDTEAIANGITAGFDYFITVVVPKIVEIFNFIKDNGDSIISIIAGIGAGFVAFNIGTMITGLITTFTTLFKALKTGDGIMKALNLTMKANPFVLVASLVASLVVAFITLWNTSEEFRNFWIGLFETIKTTVVNAVNSVVSGFTNLVTSIGNWLNKAIQTVSQFASNLLKKGAEAGKNLVNSVINAISSLPSKIRTVGKNIVEGLWNGINDMAGWIAGKIQGFGEGVLGGIKSFFGIASPSKETAYLGEMLGLGLGNGLAKMSDYVVDKASVVSNQLMDELRSNLDNITYSIDPSGTMRKGVQGSANGLRAGSSGSVTNVTFNQYNSSPKPLDSLTIYRETRKQVQQMKVLVGK